MFERKTATSPSTNNSSQQNISPSTTLTPQEESSLSVVNNHHHPNNSDHQLQQEQQEQHHPTLSNNSPSNISILRDYKTQQHQQQHLLPTTTTTTTAMNGHHHAPTHSPPHSPRQNSYNTINNNTSKRLSLKSGSNNSSKRLSVNLLLNKLGGGGGSTSAAIVGASTQLQPNNGGISSNGGGGANNNSSMFLIGGLDSNNLLISREGSQILLGVPYREGLGYRKTSHWPYRYNKRYFVLKNHHLRIYRSINDYQQHQQYSSIVKHALKQQQQDHSNNNNSNNNSNNNYNLNGSVMAANNIINFGVSDNWYNTDAFNSSNHSIVTSYGSTTSNMITTPQGDIIPKVDTSSFMLYKIPLKYCKIFKFHTSNTNESSNLDYRSSVSEMKTKDSPSKSSIATEKKEEKKEDDDEEEFELHFLPPPNYSGPGVTGQKAYKLHDEEGNNTTTNLSSSPSSVLHGDEVVSGSGANSAIFKLKFKGGGNEWFKLLDKAIFLAGKTGENEEEDVWKSESKKEFDEEEWLSQYKKEQQQDMMDLPVFLRPLQMQIQQHNDEMLIDQQEKQKQISAEKNMSLKKRLSQYFSGGGNSSNNNVKRNSSNSYAVSEKPFDMKSDNLVDSITESTTSHNSNNEKRKSGYVIDDSIPEITDMSQLQDLIRQHEHDDDYYNIQQSQPKPVSDHKNTNVLSNLKSEEKKGSALHRLSTNFTELFSKKKQQQTTTTNPLPDNTDTISVDGKREKRKSVFGRLLNINKEK